jgi:hypothetical protein
MSAAPARRFEQREPRTARAARHRSTGAAQAGARSVATERRRRERHFRRRRRDLLEDTAMALLATIVLISLTAGLGVLALLEIPIAGGLIASVIVERKLRQRPPVEKSRRPRPPR